MDKGSSVNSPRKKMTESPEIFQIRLVTTNAGKSRSEDSSDNIDVGSEGLELVSTARESDISAPRSFFARIPRLGHLLRTEWSSTDSVRIVLPSLNALEAFMTAVSAVEKGGDVAFDPYHQLQLLSIATMLGLTNLQRAAEEYISVHLRPSTLLHVLQNALKLRR